MAPGIGISEIIFIALLALIVIKPERLPEALTKIARLWRDVTGYIGQLKSALSKELADIQKLSGVKDLKDPLGLREAAEDISKGVSKDISGPLRDAAQDAKDAKTAAMEEIYPELAAKKAQEESRESAGEKPMGEQEEKAPEEKASDERAPRESAPFESVSDESAVQEKLDESAVQEKLDESANPLTEEESQSGEGEAK
jgi:sec-independent protein translocase protein TatB